MWYNEYCHSPWEGLLRRENLYCHNFPGPVARTTTIQGITMHNGNAESGGGGAVYGITTVKIGCLFAENEADVGGAVWPNAYGLDY